MTQEKEGKITVAISCYNSTKYIEAAIQSVFKQTYKNWELVIVDDGSTDNSLEVIKKLMKNKDNVKIITHDKNYGCGKTKRDAVENSTGSLVCILDSDDAITPNALEVMVNSHKNNPKASMCYSKYYNCDRNLGHKNGDMRGTLIPTGMSFLSARNTTKVSHLKCFKRTSYNMTEGFDANLLKAVDKDIILKLEEVGKLVFVDKILYYRRIHSKSLTKTLKSKVISREKLESMRNKIFSDAIERRKNPSKIERARKFVKAKKIRAIELEEIV